MSNIDKIEDKKIVDFAVNLVKENYSRVLKTNDLEGRIKLRDTAGIVTVRVNERGSNNELFYVILQGQSAEVYRFYDGSRNRFEQEFSSFMKAEESSGIGEEESSSC